MSYKPYKFCARNGAQAHAKSGTTIYFANSNEKYVTPAYSPNLVDMWGSHILNNWKVS